MANRVERALVSVFDKDGILPLARELHGLGVEILSTGGTARLLADAGIPVVSVSDHTGFPEMLDGRVKTLHPKIHGGILAVRSDPRHMADLAAHGIPTIDLVVVNLYPFERTAAKPGAAFEEIVEMIDIGGPSMVRGAAKNHAHVGVVVDPADYPGVLEEIRAGGGLTAATRLRLAAKAFRHTGAYDAAVGAYLTRIAGGAPAKPEFPDVLRLEFEKVADLVYGENPHQAAAFYHEPGAAGSSIARAKHLHGKPLSFNNVLDFDAALRLASDLEGCGCAILKHGNPCGVALAATPGEAFREALRCDPVSAFGGVIAFNRPVDADAARSVAEAFYEGVLAPSFHPEAMDALSKKKNLRLLAAGEPLTVSRSGLDLRRVEGGLLAQTWDAADPSRERRVVTKREPTADEWKALELAWTVVRHVKSNAIVYVIGGRTVGIGAGQMSRVDSARFGIQKAQTPLDGAVMASDAFFPFRDGLDVAADAGVRAVIQPGGSIRDAEVVAAADERGIAMVLTGTRHFRH